MSITRNSYPMPTQCVYEIHELMYDNPSGVALKGLSYINECISYAQLGRRVITCSSPNTKAHHSFYSIALY